MAIQICYITAHLCSCGSCHPGIQVTYRKTGRKGNWLWCWVRITQEGEDLVWKKKVEPKALDVWGSQLRGRHRLTFFREPRSEGEPCGRLLPRPGDGGCRGALEAVSQLVREESARALPSLPLLACSLRCGGIWKVPGRSPPTPLSSGHHHPPSSPFAG